MASGRYRSGIQLSRRQLLGASGGVAVTAALWPTRGVTQALNATAAAVTQAPMVAKGDANYEPWRQSMMWQYRKSDRFPDMIATASTVDDVIAIVRQAAASGRKIANRAGGHSMSACFLRDSGLLLDVSRLTEMRLDAANNQVIVGPGVIARGLNEFLRPHGLAVSTTHCGMVPISGFHLGGGVGWNGNAWGGMAVFNINAVDIVTADGVLRHASPSENSDLFWAVRGGGPGLFGTVVRFYLKCYPLPKAIRSIEYTFAFSDLVEVVRAIEEIGPKVDRNVELLTIVTKAPEDLAHRCTGPGCDQAVFVNAIVFGDSEDEAKRKLLPLTSHAILKKAIHQLPLSSETFESLYYGNELPFPQKRWEADNVMTDQASKIAQLLLDSVPNCPTDNNAAVLVYKGTHDFPDAAYTTIGKFYLAYYMVWENAEDDVAVKKYHVDFFKKAQALSNGSYINEFNQEGRPEDIPLCYTPKNWARLKDLRKKWDAGGVYHDFYGQV